MLLEGLLRRRHRGRHRLVPACTNVRINRRAGPGCGSIPSIHSRHRGERGRRSVRFLNHLLLVKFVKKTHFDQLVNEGRPIMKSFDFG